MNGGNATAVGVDPDDVGDAFGVVVPAVVAVAGELAGSDLAGLDAAPTDATADVDGAGGWATDPTAEVGAELGAAE